MVGPYPTEPDKIIGGVAAVTSYLSRALVSDFDIDLHGVSFGPRGSVYEKREDLGYPVHFLPTEPFGPLTLYRRARSSFDRLMERIEPDLIHGQGADVRGFLAARSQYPSVVTIHGLVGEDAKYLTGFKTRVRARLVSRRIEARTVELARNLISISPFVEEYYGARLRAKTRYIPNPTADRFYRIDHRPEIGRFLFAGHINPRKGVSELVLAFEKMKQHANARLILAGSTDINPEYFAQVKNLCSEHGIENRVEFRGVLTTPELLEELSRAQALVLASYQETAPMVIQEAMAGGVPVIASNICGIPYQVEHGVTGWLVEPGDVTALSDRMQELLNDPSLSARMGSSAKDKAESFSAGTVARSTAEFYSDITSRSDTVADQ